MRAVAEEKKGQSDWDSEGGISQGCPGRVRKSVVEKGFHVSQGYVVVRCLVSSSSYGKGCLIPHGIETKYVPLKSVRLLEGKGKRRRKAVRTEQVGGVNQRL